MMTLRKTFAAKPAWLLGGLLLGLLAPARAATLTVNTPSDDSDGDCTVANCSLREAITAANTLAGTDTITFAANLSSTPIILQSALPPITTDMTITGSTGSGGQSSGTTVSRVAFDSGTNNYFGIFTVGTPTVSGTTPTNTVTFSNLNIKGGYGGNSAAGGTSVFTANLTLNNCTLSQNDSVNGGGIASQNSILTINSSSVSNNAASSNGGGLLALNSTINITGSTIQGNIASSSGGGIITQSSTVTLVGCNLQGNIATSSLGGGIAMADGSLSLSRCSMKGNSATTGGAILSSAGGTITLTNSTFDDNTARDGGGGIYFMNALTVRSCTFVNNSAPTGGAIVSGGNSFTLDNNIFQSGSQGGTIFNANSSSVIQDNGYNLSDDSGGGMLTKSTDKIQTDAKLGARETISSGVGYYPLRGDSPAIDAGNTNLTVDIRNMSRPEGTNDDIGAYEFKLREQLEVTTLTDENNGNSDVSSGSGTSLREAIIYANKKSGDDTITFKSGLAGTITLDSALPNLSTNIVIQGPTASAITISGKNAVRLFYVTGTVRISNLTLQNGSAASSSDSPGSGGAIFTSGELSLDSCTLTANNAKRGGAIFTSAESGKITSLRNCTFAGNSASGDLYRYGGAVCNLNGLTVIESCTISNNSADTGSGIATYGNAATHTQLRNSIVAGNNATSGNVNTDVYYLNTQNPYQSKGYNLIGVGSGDAAGPFKLTGDQVIGTASPGLSPLANNGGPTQTMALLLTSPALNKGNAGLGTDQRGIARPQGGKDDIGAFELIADTTAPTIAVTEPAAKVMTLPAISGTATDNVGVTKVVFYLKRNSDSKFWTGTAWGTTTPLTTTLGGTPTNRTWTRNSGLPAGNDFVYGSYTLTAYAFDAANNRAEVKTVFLRNETEAPTIAVTTPANKAVLKNGLPSIGGTAADNGGSGVFKVVFYLRRTSDNKYWNGTTWGGAFALPADYTGGQWSKTSGLPSGANLPLTTYVVTAYAIDTANNRTSVISTFTIAEGVAPVAAITSPVNGSTVNTLTQVTGTASDSGGSGLQRVAFYFRRLSDSKYWNGSTWVAGVFELPTTITGTTWKSTALPSGANLTDGVYQARAIAVDGSFNTSPTAISQFTFKRTAAIATASGTSPVTLSSIKAKTDGTVTLTFTGPLGANATNSSRYRLDQGGVDLAASAVQQTAPSTIVLSVDGLSAGERVTANYDLSDTLGRSITGSANVIVR